MSYPEVLIDKLQPTTKILDHDAKGRAGKFLDVFAK